MTASRRFRPVQQVTEQRERKAATALAERVRARQQAEAQLQSLRGYYQDYLRRFQEAARNGMDVARVREFQRFLDKLEQAIAEQQLAVQQAQAACDSAKGSWRQKHTRSRVMETVMERLHEEERRAEGKREQALTDEQNQRRQRR